MDAPSRDDIDVQELAVRIIRYFQRHLVFILIFCMAGIGLGVTAYKTSPNVYESQMVVLSDLLTKTYGDRIDQSLNNLIREGNFTELSGRLALPVERVSSLTAVKIESVLDVKTPQREKIEKDETYFIITVHLTDRSALPDLQEGILKYLRSNELVKVRTRQREALATAVVDKIDREQKSIDSLKKVLFQKGSLKGENLQFDPSALFTTSVDLTRLRWEAQQELELANSIHLVEGFTSFEKPKDPKLPALIVIGFFLGLIVSVGLLTLNHLFNLARS